MVIPLSSDFDSCHIAVRYEGVEHEVKIDSSIMHKLKSLGGVNTSYLNIHVTFKARYERYGRILKNLKKKTLPSKLGLGGYRIEVTVSAQTLFEARRIIQSTEFPDINSWIYPTKPQLQPFKLDIKAITKEQNIQNAKAMRVAKSLPI
ncbi:hypothetical protein D1P53_000788 [Cryptococcus gattii VGV]|nr:hypothetical protein D1P53_000788 [Cryptococcus gattii VGV]